MATSGQVGGPRWLLGLRGVQILLAVIIMGLTGYSANYILLPALEAAYGLILFTAASTIIINIWLFVSILAVPVAYNMWANLATEIFLVIFWLISFATLAAYTSDLNLGELNDDFGFQNYPPWDTGAAAAGLGGLEFILFIVTLVISSLELHRLRISGTTGAPVQETKYQTGPTQEAGVPLQAPVHQAAPQYAAQPAAAAPAAQQTQPAYSNAPEAVPQPAAAPSHFTQQPVGTQAPY
ncbi:MAG: hypothetical protein M1838_002322 [Thelocarpon superellum]|nr:MAG: hypothetical protein M1838_002322 [Thelocarpon superellum]